MIFYILDSSFNTMMTSSNKDSYSATRNHNILDPGATNFQDSEKLNQEVEQRTVGAEDGSGPDDRAVQVHSSQLSPDISLSSQRTLRYCDVEADQQGAHDTSHESSDSIETIDEPPPQDTHVELNNKILEQLSLTCQNLKNSVESHQRAEKERRENKSPLCEKDEFVSSGDSHEVIPELTDKPRPKSLSLPSPLQAAEKDKRQRGSESNSESVSQRQVESTDTQLEEQGACFIDSENLSSNLPSGTIVRKGEMIEFVADNLEEKIKLSSPLGGQESGSGGSRRSSVRSTVSASSSTSFATSSGPSRSPSSLFQQSPDDIPPIDAAAVIELENHARRVADSLDLMMGNIGNNLHKMSAITIGCEDAYKRSVDITCDSVDASIKSMYALMAKCEELSAAMGPVAQLAVQIKEIKRILDLFESQLSDKQQ